MPHLVKQPPKYRLHKASSQAVVSISGKAIYLGPYGSAGSHRKYQELLSEWQSAHAQSTEETVQLQADLAELKSITAASLREKRRNGQAISIAELILVYERYSHQYYRKNGELTREAELIDEVLLFLRKRHGEDAVDQFGPVALDDLRDAMIDDLDWSRKHINKQVGRIIRMLKWAASKELCNSSIPNDLKALAGLKKGRCRARETKGVKSVDDAVVEATFAKLGDVVSDMVRFQRLTGARPSEVCSIRPCDIDRTGDVWAYVPSAHKTEHYEKDRVIAIGPKAQAILLPYLVRAAESFCFSPAESEERRKQKAYAASTSKRPSRRVAYPKRKPSDHYKVASYRMAIRRACSKLGIEAWSPNQLRHTAATEIRKEFGLEAAQVVCGHQSADITQIYAERNLELAKHVAHAVG